MINLIQGDCLEVMCGLPSNSVDAVVTDPPFGIGFDYSGKREINNNPQDYWSWLEPRIKEAKRILRSGGLLAVWQAQPYMRHFWSWFGDDIHIYCAAKNFVQLRKVAINYAYDPVVMQYKVGSVLLRPEKPARNVDFFVANTAAIVSNTTRIEKQHPCPRPLDHVTGILSNFALPGGVVLDCFMGSGTTGVACINTGRDFIGIELDKGYFALAQRRITEAEEKARQMTFDGVA
jgi:site-specific DNA-methyltransferase (adenine-specific)